MESDHPCLVLDSWRKPAIRRSQPCTPISRQGSFLGYVSLPVTANICTRSYAVGMDTATVQKEHVISAKNWTAALGVHPASIPNRGQSSFRAATFSRLKAANITELGTALLDIPHVRRMRLATKALAVQPMKFINRRGWTSAVLGLINRGRDHSKTCACTLISNHPSEVTLKWKGDAAATFRRRGGTQQTVLLRGVNDDSTTLRSLFQAPRCGQYPPLLCVSLRYGSKGPRHFRVSLALAQTLEKEVRGARAGFNTPLFIV